MRLTHVAGLAVVGIAVAALALQLGKAQDPMTPLAERYVKLVLALGQHDAGYVDAYYGPQGWKDQAAATPRSRPDISGFSDSPGEARRRSEASSTRRGGAVSLPTVP